MMAGLNPGTAFNPLQALGASPASGGQDDLDEVIRRIQQLLNPGAGSSSPMRPSPSGQPYMPLSPSPAPPGYRLNENQGPGGLSAPGLPVEAVGDVVDFRKRGLFPQLGTEGARGYSGGANPQGWNVGQRATRTGTPEWNAAYEAQAGLKPGSLEPITRAPIQAEFPGRPAYQEMPGMSSKQLGQAIRNRASAEKRAQQADYARTISTDPKYHQRNTLKEAQEIAKNAPRQELTGAELALARQRLTQRIPLMQKQAAEAQTLNKLRDNNVQFEKQWGDFGVKNGIDPAKAVRIAKALRVEAEAKGLGHISDSQIKFAITLLKQKGQL